MKTFLTLIIFLSGLLCLNSQTFTEIQRLRMNTKDFSEFAPYMNGGKMYFCSNRKTSFTVNATDGDKPVFYHNVFEVKDTSVFRVTEFPEPVNTLANDGPMCFDKKGTLYISRNFAQSEKNNQPAKVGVFTHTIKDGKWSEKIPFEYNDTKWNTGHPSLSPDDKFLFFTSDKPSGYGGFDIYFCKFENGKWSAPLNAGSTVNGPGNELYPYCHSSGKFFFSSDRDTTCKYDIFSSTFDNGKFGSSQKVESPINSKFNDFSFWCDATTENGFFATDRNGTDDIYRFRTTFPVFEQCDSIKITNFCYTFYEENSYEIDTSMMAYEWDFGDVKIRKKEADFCFPGPGSYEISLNIIDKTTGEVFQNQASYTMDIQEAIQPVITIPDKIPAGKEIVLSAEKSNLPGFEILGYFWRLSDESKFSGLTINHSFTKPGKYTAWLGVILKDTANDSTVKKCVFKDFEVGYGK